MTNYSIFRVIKIIDDYSIVINGGVKHDISLDDEIEIYLEGDEVVDPFNNNISLGTLDYIKNKLVVTEVYPEFSVCKKIVEEETYVPTSLEYAFSNFRRGKTVTTKKVVEIKVNHEEKTGRKTGDKTISIGDMARIALD